MRPITCTPDCPWFENLPPDGSHEGAEDGYGGDIL